MIEVDRVVDDGRPQGVALQVQRLGAVGLRDVGRLPSNVHAQITMRSISSTVAVSAVRS